jgi:transcriptional regulator with XRE-family HTH domain
LAIAPHEFPQGTATGQLVQSYAAKRGLSLRELARKIGRSDTAVQALANGGLAGRSTRYLGLRPFRRGDRPLLELVIETLEIPDREVRRALALDLGIEGR